MGNNIAILTDTAKTVTLDTINDYGAGVFGHVTQDFAQHTQIQVYNQPYALTSDVVLPANILVKIYDNIGPNQHNPNDKGTHLIFSNLYGTLTTSDIQFYANTSGNWHPFGLVSYSADFTGIIIAAVDGNYTFTLASDDGGYLFIDNVLIVSEPGDHTVFNRSGTVFLTAGAHALELQFWANYHNPSGVNLTLPTGITYAPTYGTVENVITTESLYLGLTFNGSTIPLALPLNSTGSNVAQNSPPIIIIEPQNLVDAGIGSIAQFSVAVLSNIPVTYQWQRNAPVSTAGQQTLKTQAIALQTAIADLQLSGFNGTGTGPQLSNTQRQNQTRATRLAQTLVSELPDSLTVPPPPNSLSDAQALVPLVKDTAVSAQIQRLIAAINATAAFATGAGTPFNSLPGQTAANLVMTNVQSTDAALYRVVVTNANGTTISTYGTLVVTAFKAPNS